MEAKAKRKGAVCIALLAVLALGVAAGIVLAALSLSSSRSALRLLEQNFTDPDQQTQEDGVRILNYTIRSTAPISDAYRSGDLSALDDRERETLDLASNVLDEILTDGMTPYEQEQAVYDWMAVNLQGDSGVLTVIPTSQADADNPYGALKYHNAVCVGYATTFRLFMQMLDIPCMVVHNTENYHSWNLVQLDGDWYHTDVYSDAGTGSYAHFNLSDAMLTQEGSVWDTSFFPAANSLKYNPANRNALEGVEPLEIPARLREALDAGEKLLSIRFGQDFTERQASLALELVSEVQALVFGSDAYDGADLYGAFYPVDDGFLLIVTIDRVEGEASELTEEELAIAAAAVQEAFPDLSAPDEPPEDQDAWYEEEEGAL